MPDSASCNPPDTPPVNLPLLSLLIPAYSYPEGILRILSLLAPTHRDLCEVIIFDDSPDTAVEDGVAARRHATGYPIHYQHNQPALGAIANWNALLDAARGQYCLLMHHDEFPLDSQGIRNLLDMLRQNPATDVVMLDCVLVSPQDGYNRRHLPTWLRKLVVSRFPQYLYRRNVVGPTASLMIRRTLYPRFDVRLKWLVDVDVYVELFKQAPKILVCPEIGIGSILHRSDSITARLGSSIPRILDEERTYLRASRDSNGNWLGPYPEEPLIHKVWRILETAAWCGLRAWTRLLSFLHLYPMSRSLVQQALQPHSEQKTK